MAEGEQGQKGKDAVVAEGDVGGNSNKAHHQRHNTALEQLLTQGGANGVNGDAFGIQGARNGLHLLHQGGRLAWIEVLESQDEGLALIQHLNGCIAQVGRTLARFSRQRQRREGPLDLGGRDGRAAARSATAFQLDLGATGEVEAGFERSMDPRIQPTGQQANHAQDCSQA